MDLSKLPKLSNTTGPAPQQYPEPNPLPIEAALPATAAPPPQPTPQPMSHRPASVGGEIWISLIVGILLTYLGGTFGRYLLATLSHQPFHTGVNWTEGPSAGTEVAYFELEGFTAWTDMGVFLFGLTLLFEAAAKTLLAIKPGSLSRLVLVLAIVLTAVAVLLNIVCCVKLFGIGITPLLSGLAVAFGGWILFDELTTLKRTA